MKTYFDVRPKETIRYTPSGKNSVWDFQFFDLINNKFIPTVCMHGGSEWLCNKCSAELYREWKNNIVNLNHWAMRKCQICKKPAKFIEQSPDGPPDYFCSIRHHKEYLEMMRKKGLVWRALPLRESTEEDQCIS
uniref:Uncharacterized protein n=1 Tax=viral metagenome TaxID=1070528 RepID=A0A6M3IS49_9ZZZZ